MKKLTSLILALLLLVLGVCMPKDSFAKYDPTTRSNNIYGIHIINLSDIHDAEKLVNSTNGDWGYVTVVIAKDQRNVSVWQDFFDQARRLHLIPIVRVATESKEGVWVKPDINEIDGWVNFFNSLNWVIENRYVAIGNEPNHAKEWGGEINPAEYGTYLKTFSQRLKNSNPDYFVLSAGLDQAANNSKSTMDENKYIEELLKTTPDIFEYIDGWNSHSYPNPDFSASAKNTSRKSIKGYEWEINLIKSLGISKDFPVFITETGWSNSKLTEDEIAQNYKYAYEEVWSKDKKVVAVTPFILNYTQDPFSEFSWKKDDGTFFKQYNEVSNLQKIKGNPRQFIDGKIIFSYLTSIGKSNSSTKGYLFVENTGQNIWNTENAFLMSENDQEVKISDINLTPIFPFEGKFIGYALTYPEKEGESDLKIGLYIEEKRIGDAYNGKIYTYISTESLRQNLLKRLFLIFLKIQSVRS